MSQSLTRRIAQAALVVAAGAAPLAAAGSAAAAGDLVPQGDLGKSVTALDGADHSSTLQTAAHNVGQAAGNTTAATAATGIPAATDATAATIESAAPQASGLLDKISGPLDKTATATGALATVADRAVPAVSEKLSQAATGHRAGAPGNPLGSMLPLGALGSLTKSVPGGDALGGLTGQATDHRLGGPVPPLGNNPTDALPLGEVTHLLGGLGGLGGIGGGAL